MKSPTFLVRLWHVVENGYTCGMGRSDTDRWHWAALWLARLTVGLVFFFNVNCALAFIIHPASYSPGFEVSGVPGEVLVRGIGVLFLMWNATYPLVLAKPERHQALFGVILVQQAIGLAGESWMWLTLPKGHEALRITGERFIIFDGSGLLTMGLAFWLLRRAVRGRTERLQPQGGTAYRSPMSTEESDHPSSDV